MDKQAIEDLAVDIADDMGYDYFDVSPKLRAKIYKIAMDDFSDMMADKADMMRKNEAAGGMMRANYANGSEDEFMELVERLREQGFSQQEAIEEARERLSKNMAYGGRIGYAMGSEDQASGIKSLEGTKMMASSPDPMAEKNDMSLDLFGKPLELLTEEEMYELEEKIEDQFGKRSAPSIKMAELDDDADSAMYEYKKYVFEMRELGLEPMSFREFLAEALSEARG
jgi:hypothetical protein